MVSAQALADVRKRSAVDVTFLAVMRVDKSLDRMSLPRQNQRLVDCGVRVSRRSLTNWAGCPLDLLVPLAESESAHVLTGRVLEVYETTIKAGRAQPGKMRTA